MGIWKSIPVALAMGCASTQPVSDPTADLGAHPGCESFNGDPSPGATSYFVGDFFLGNDNAITGSDYWFLYANSALEAADGTNCLVVWSVSGYRQENCASEDNDVVYEVVEPDGQITAHFECDYRLEISGAIDNAATTCDPSLYIGNENYGVAYDVLESEGRTTFFFASGTRLGSGEANGSRITYTSDYSCTWL